MRIGDVWRAVRVLATGSLKEQVLLHQRLMLFLKRKGKRRLAARVSRRLQRRYHLFLPASAKIAGIVDFPHPTGIVIGADAVIGRGVTIFQNVTIGGDLNRETGTLEYPTIGDGARIYGGAVIFGPVLIGVDATVGPNAVVRINVPDGATAVGVPARIVTATDPDRVPEARLFARKDRTLADHAPETGEEGD